MEDFSEFVCVPFLFYMFLLTHEEDGRSDLGASCCDGSLKDVGQGFDDRDNGETSVDLRFVSDCPESFWPMGGHQLRRLSAGTICLKTRLDLVEYAGTCTFC